MLETILSLVWPRQPNINRRKMAGIYLQRCLYNVEFTYYHFCWTELFVCCVSWVHRVSCPEWHKLFCCSNSERLLWLWHWKQWNLRNCNCDGWVVAHGGLYTLSCFLGTSNVLFVWLLYFLFVTWLNAMRELPWIALIMYVVLQLVVTAECNSAS